MKSETPFANARDYVASLASRGRYHFTSSDAQAALGVSADAAKLALNRLSRRKAVSSPARGFYVILPPEYRSLGCLPADQFVPALMQRLERPYYAGLLSAAQYHGAAHHGPQQFQVMVEKPKRLIRCGSVSVAFFVRSRLDEVAVQSLNTPRGTLLVSTPEATAVDLVGYAQRLGGLDQVVTVLIDLAEKIDPEKLVRAAMTAPIPWAQRLGFLLERAKAGVRTGPLAQYVKDQARQTTALSPKGTIDKSLRDAVWKLYVNADVEPEF